MKVEFLSSLVVEKLAGREWRLHRRFVVEVEGEPIVIPRGFVTDFASVPRVPLAYLLAGGIGEKAATLHDWLYAEQRDRAFADRAFRAALELEGEPRWRARLMYAGVRLGGAGRYGERGPALVVPSRLPEGVGF